ncbi:unnamed protein product [Peronospora belbahrii]|uniref:TRP C-terminal domain-containing protein n=1 Tax=Peronospora belbahrii TaxID=622444 RepID=A0ABN8D9I6_9STRA|nr:unnamed protein product [Peronospora belbahrii]
MGSLISPSALLDSLHSPLTPPLDNSTPPSDNFTPPSISPTGNPSSPKQVIATPELGFSLSQLVKNTFQPVKTPELLQTEKDGSKLVKDTFQPVKTTPDLLQSPKDSLNKISSSGSSDSSISPPNSISKPSSLPNVGPLTPLVPFSPVSTLVVPTIPPAPSDLSKGNLFSPALSHPKKIDSSPLAEDGLLPLANEDLLSKSSSIKIPDPNKLLRIEKPITALIVKKPIDSDDEISDAIDIVSRVPVPKVHGATKSPLAIETNPVIEDETYIENGQDALEQKYQTQSDVVMYDASAKPIIASISDSYDPFAIPDDIIETEKAVVLDFAGGTNGDGSDNLMTYVRGKAVAPDKITSGGPSVIGGRNTYVDTNNSDVLSSSAATFHEFLRFASVAFAGISVALLLFFHFVSLDANLLWVNAAWSPNTWEFLFYVGYLQQMQATSELTLFKTPYFVWDYTDSFAWSNFLIQGSTSDSTEPRRLETIVLGGLVSYSDRIGIPEANILVQGAIGFAVIMGILVAVFLVLAVLAKRKAERALDESSDLNSYTSGVHRLRSVSIRALGLCVLAWYFALFPLSMLASFEISMEKQASSVGDALVVAIIALVLVCFGVLAVAGRVIMHKTKDELEQFENLATWGSLYCEYTYRSRMFFVIDVVVQITTGILVGSVSGDPTQLIVVTGIQALYLACVFIMSPFAEILVLRITYALGLLKILNFGLAFAFLNTNSMSASARMRVAHAYIGINSIVILVWFLRQLIVFSTYIRAWMVRSNDNSRHSNSVFKYNPRTETESDMWASQFNGFNDSRLNDSRLNPSVNGATLSMPPGSSVQSMHSSEPSNLSANFMPTHNLVSSQQSMIPSFGSEAQFQQQMARKYEIGF